MLPSENDKPYLSNQNKTIAKPYVLVRQNSSDFHFEKIIYLKKMVKNQY